MDGNSLIQVEYDVFRDQTVNEKLNTLFLKIEDLRSREGEVSRRAKWYATIGGFIGAVTVVFTALGAHLTGFTGGK